MKNSQALKRNSFLDLSLIDENMLNAALKEKKDIKSPNNNNNTKKINSKDYLELSRDKKDIKTPNNNYKIKIDSKDYLDLSKDPGFLKPTFNSKIRSKKDVNNKNEYNYYKERQLLEFLTLKSAKNKEWQKNVQEKLRILKKRNIEYDSEKGMLLDKLNHFDPVRTKDVNDYLELASQNKVNILYKIFNFKISIFSILIIY